jgi:sigma-B regulation protein RsbU (phosphoserine phosphatase)
MAYREMQEINRELDSKVQELRTLFELGKSFNAVFNQEQVLKIFGLTLMGQVGSMRFAVLLREGETVSTKMDTERLDLMKDRLFLSITSPMLIPAVQSEKRPTQLFQQCRELGIEALIPLQVQNEVKGIVCLGARRTGKHYSQADLEFVFSLGNLAIISFENSRLFKEAVEKQRMESELDIAREIQRGLLPKVIPVIQGFDAAALTIPSRQVGGDYYDVIALEGGNYAFAIGDVSGKGTPASLLMASVQATVRALAHFPGSLSDLTVRINHLICENTSGGRFITFFWGILNPTTREFRYVNAGHNLPFLMRSDGSIDRLGEGGIILGVLQSGVAYREGSTSLHPGDTLLMFTDGISEAMDKNGIDYTEERIHTFLFEIRNHTASEMIEAIREEISKYTSGAPQSDDITLLVLKAR